MEQLIKVIETVYFSETNTIGFILENGQTRIAHFGLIPMTRDKFENDSKTKKCKQEYKDRVHHLFDQLDARYYEIISE
ncbi:MAG: hypothetical protein GY861_05425 [bacterium]|nr:hypothetical protein [bacterium]